MSITVYGGIEYLRRNLERDLGLAGACLEPIKCIVVDRPVGWALLPQHASKLSKALVLSDNPCAEYRLNLLECDPVGLVGEISLNAILDAVTLLNLMRLRLKRALRPLNALAYIL